jgi:hypothetical protein
MLLGAAVILLAFSGLPGLSEPLGSMAWGGRPDLLGRRRLSDRVRQRFAIAAWQANASP